MSAELPAMAPGGIEPPHAGSKPAALSTELRGRVRREPVCPTTPRYPVQGAVAVAQLVEPRVVVPVVAGSSPVRHLGALERIVEEIGHDFVQAPFFGESGGYRGTKRARLALPCRPGRENAVSRRAKCRRAEVASREDGNRGSRLRRKPRRTRRFLAALAFLGAALLLPFLRRLVATNLNRRVAAGNLT